jgi:hypothetical protein
MTTRSLKVEASEITDFAGLDPIRVFWSDDGPGRGCVVITCYGCAWTAYWAAMGTSTIRQFFADADVGYLVTNLGITPLLKQRKADHSYLSKIITAVKASLAGEGSPEVDPDSANTVNPNPSDAAEKSANTQGELR